MYALIINTEDYTNTKFITHEQIAHEEYLQEVDDAKEDGYTSAIALIKINGDGNFNIGQGIDVNGNVDLILTWYSEE